MSKADFTDFESTDTDPLDTSGEPAKDVDGTPYCRDHHCRMKRSSGGKKGNATVYYKCPVDGCECKQQIVKVARESLIPTAPMTCPRCAGGNSICVRDKKHSDAYGVILACPGCGWRSNKLATPQYASLQEQRRKIATQRIVSEEIGER